MIGSRVAEVMGPTFTEGSIVQHLAKLRIKMEQNVMHVPPLKSGMVTESSKMHATSNKKRRAMETSTLEQTDESVRRTEGNGCGGGQRAFSEQDDELSLSMLYDRNGIYGTAKKARRSRRPAVEIKERDFDMLTAAAATCQTSIGRDDSGPAARTPGRIRDHAKMEIGASDEGFEDNQDKVGADANKGVDAEKCAKLWIMGTTRAGRGLGEQVSPCFQATPVGNCQNLLGSPFGGNSEVGGQFVRKLNMETRVLTNSSSHLWLRCQPIPTFRQLLSSTLSPQTTTAMVLSRLISMAGNIRDIPTSTRVP